ncbi:MAG TPA: signal peptidase I [Acidimicrobiales bacterium]|nr:signal peptidase I [Acidimicrobiales bacterium]
MTFAPTLIRPGAYPEEPLALVTADPARPQMLHRAGSSLSTVAVGLLMAVSSLTLVVAVASHFSPQGQYVVFGHPVLSVLSSSMSPAIKTGDLVIDSSLTAAQAGSLHAGQVITFRSSPGSQRFFTHRIVAVDRTASGAVSYVTKGDVNNAPDAGAVPVADVVGLYQTKVPFGGYVLSDLRQPMVLFLLAAVPLLLLLGGPLWRWASDGDATERRRQAALRLRDTHIRS